MDVDAPIERSSSDLPRREQRPPREPFPRRRRAQPLLWAALVLLGALPPTLVLAFRSLDRGPQPSPLYQRALAAHVELLDAHQLDAYRRPEATEVIDLLEGVPSSSADYLAARDLLARYRWERQRAELEALEARAVAERAPVAAERPIEVPPEATPPVEEEPPPPAQPPAAAPRAVAVPVDDEEGAEALLAEAEAKLATRAPTPSAASTSRAPAGKPRLEASKDDVPVAFDSKPLRNPTMDELRAHVKRSGPAADAPAPASAAPDASPPPPEAPPPPAPAAGGDDLRVEADAGYRCYVAAHGSPYTRPDPAYEIRLGTRAGVMVDGTVLSSLRALREIAYGRLEEERLAPLAAILGPLPEDVLESTRPFFERGVHLTLLDSPSGALLIDPLKRYEECQATRVTRVRDFGRGPRAGSDARKIGIALDEDGWFKLLLRVPSAGGPGRAIEVSIETPESSYPAMRFQVPAAPPAAPAS